MNVKEREEHLSPNRADLVGDPCDRKQRAERKVDKRCLPLVTLALAGRTITQGGEVGWRFGGGVNGGENRCARQSTQGGNMRPSEITYIHK